MEVIVNKQKKTKVAARKYQVQVWELRETIALHDLVKQSDEPFLIYYRTRLNYYYVTTRLE